LKLYFVNSRSALKGVRTIKQNHPSLDPIFVFISPPSLSVLRSRLVGRGTETENAIATRLETALREIEYAKSEEGNKIVDLTIVNDELDRAYALLEKVALGEEKVQGDTLPEFVDSIN
jgi:guanylate kinase